MSHWYRLSTVWILIYSRQTTSFQVWTPAHLYLNQFYILLDSSPYCHYLELSLNHWPKYLSLPCLPPSTTPAWHLPWPSYWAQLLHYLDPKFHMLRPLLAPTPHRPPSFRSSYPQPSRQPHHNYCPLRALRTSSSFRNLHGLHYPQRHRSTYLDHLCCLP